MKKRNELARREVFEIVELEDRELTQVIAGLESVLVDEANVFAGCNDNFGCKSGCTNNCPSGCGN